MEAQADGTVKLSTGDQIRFGFGGRSDVPHVNGVPLRGVTKIALESGPDTEFAAKLSLDMLVLPARPNAEGTDAERYVIKGVFVTKDDFETIQRIGQQVDQARALSARVQPKIGDTCEMTGELEGAPGRVGMVLSLVPTHRDLEVLQRLLEMTEEAAAADPTAEERRAAGRAVGLKVSFEVDPEDVREFIAGKRADLKTWYLTEKVTASEPPIESAVG